jgi:beta-lactamase superfamily II metal-dependent hydrolase
MNYKKQVAMFFRFILGWMFWCSGVLLAVQKSTLEICFFNTGQGNFIAIRANDVSAVTQETISKLIFIDCGSTLHQETKYGKLLEDKEDPRNQRLVELFKGISLYGVLITHNHADHDNLIDTVRSISGYEREKNITRTVIRPMSRRVFMDDFRKNKIADALKKDWEKFCNEELPYIENSLGPRVRVVPIRPEKWQNNNAQNLEHDFNMMYLVEFAGRKILFSGDVSPQLFRQIEEIPKYMRELAAIDFLVLPHHGSNRAGELMTFSIIGPEMCIVCSNPDERDHLPWGEIGRFSFRRFGDVFTRKHVVSTKEGKIKNQKPIFVTCNATQGYYELVIEADGTATLFDGPTAKKLNLFCFRSL